MAKTPALEGCERGGVRLQLALQQYVASFLDHLTYMHSRIHILNVVVLVFLMALFGGSLWSIRG